MEAIVHRGWFKRFMRRRSVSEQLDLHNLKINNALSEFQVISVSFLSREALNKYA